jgi:DNA-binding transcriptional ArsR family regulator
MVMVWLVRGRLLKVNQVVKLDSPEVDRIFHALADSTRRQMLDTLIQSSATVSELARPFEMSLVAASKHVRVLEEAGLIRSTKQGRTRTCEINRAALTTASEVLSYYHRFWEQRLDGLESFLKGSAKGKKR